MAYSFFVLKKPWYKKNQAHRMKIKVKIDCTKTMAPGGCKNMSNLTKFLCTSVCALSMLSLIADEVGFIPEQDTHITPLELTETSVSSQEVALVEPATSGSPLSAQTEFTPITEPAAIPVQALAAPEVKKVQKVPFSPFTGKIKGKKVRMRLNPDTDSLIIRELNKGEMVSVVEEKEDFYVVEAPRNMKAYVFRKFVLDDTIEGNRVNIRMQPSTDAPILAHLNSGDKVEGAPCSSNSKWMEIALPAETSFYVAKNLVDRAGPPEMKEKYDLKRDAAEQMLETAAFLASSEMKKSFPEVDLEKLTQTYQAVVADFPEFSDLTEKAKEALTHLQESYIDKRIAYLDGKQSDEDVSNISVKTIAAALQSVTDKMKLWDPIEEALYLSWSSINDNRNMEEYYAEQKMAAVPITGILEPYLAPVKCKPGNFIVRDKDLPVAYVYSTQVNLDQLVGKQVTLMGAPRPNNNFAFPAFYVIAAE